MEICFEGIGQVVATFRTEDEKLEAGTAVTLTGNGEVGPGKDGKPLCGVTVGAVRGGASAVQIGGGVKVSCADEGTFDVGYAALACDSEGKVTADEEKGANCLVLAVDADGKSVTVRL